MMKRGAKRSALSDSDPNSDIFALKSKRVMDEPESSHTSLDLKRGESARQHVRALNNQFASWVQLQLQNHPDELWEDGVKDYLSHASHILETFKDVVECLKAEAAKSETIRVAPLFNNFSKPTPVFEMTKSSSKPDVNNGISQGIKSPVPSTAQSVSLSSMNQSAQSGSSFLQNSTQPSSQNSSIFSTSQKITSSSLQNSSISNSQSSVFFGFSQSQTSSPSSSFSSLSSSGFPSSQSAGLFNFGQATANSNSQTSGASSSQGPGFFSFTPKPADSSSGLGLSNSQSSSLFAMKQSPVFGGAQSFITQKVEASGEDADEENELEQPSSPSLKKTEEKGVIVVHEVKCKVYVKLTGATLIILYCCLFFQPDNPEDKGWKDMGMGQLAIKCKEGASKAAKDSKPTIIIRNDVGRILLNALIYSGIKTNVKKNTIATIFHTSGSGPDDGNESGKSSVVARTYLLKLKTEDDTTKLAAAIQDYAPSV